MSRVPYFIVLCLWLASIFGAPPSFADGASPTPICGTKRVCGDMATCAEAYHYLTHCGLSDLDRNNNGIPCEKICGKDKATMDSRMAAEPFNPVATTGALSLLTPAQHQAGAMTCGTKTTCRQMTSCDEAKHYLNDCGMSRLDKDGDGVPCEGLCR